MTAVGLSGEELEELRGHWSPVIRRAVTIVLAQSFYKPSPNLTADNAVKHGRIQAWHSHFVIGFRVAMEFDAVVVGSGPNGLAAAITLARQQRSVLVLESDSTIGGGMRSSELTLPGFVHDVCSAIHPLGVASPFFQQIPLTDFGLQWVEPDLPVAHPLPDGSAGYLHRSLESSVDALGEDANSYRRLVEPLLDRSNDLFQNILAPIGLPANPILMTRFGLRGLPSAQHLAMHRFRNERVRGLIAGMAAHSILPLDSWLTASVAVMFLTTVHCTGWPFPAGGAQGLADAMARYLESLGGKLETGTRVRSVDDIPSCKAMLFDVSPRNLVSIVGKRLPSRYRDRLVRFQHGPGIFKLDWALSGPIPWTSEACRRAGTVHVGGTFAEVARSEKEAWGPDPSDHPFVLVAQHTLFDSKRAPNGQHTGWGYCHVPAGCDVDMTEPIENQIERFAPGFKDLILERHAMSPSDYERYNPNYIGGDITGGVMNLKQILSRPTMGSNPYQTPDEQIFLCSASTPPGGGVHGMCGYHAANSALRSVLR